MNCLLKLALSICLAITTHSSLPGQIIQFTKLSENILQYDKSEWEVKIKASWTNPYDASDIALNMKLVSPSGKLLTLPCYYESGDIDQPSIWKARFTPRENGTYHFKFELLDNYKIINESDDSEFLVTPSDKKGFLNINNYWTFKYDNGELFRGIGENICWESRDEDDSRHFEGLHENPRYNYDFMLKKLTQNGGNFFRTWMIYWNLPVDWKTVKNNRRYQSTSSPFNESGLDRMDKLTDLCDSLGLHMMLALESHAGMIGTGWELNNYNVINGGYAKNPLEFFTLHEAKAQYKNKLRLMVARYGYSPSIAAWEFFNEIDNVMYSGKPEDNIPDSVITAWHDEMSSYLKEIDPYDHIVTTSISHRDVAGMNDLKNIDINQRHIYKNTDVIPSTIIQFTKKHEKPYIIGEFGYEWDWSKNFNDFAGDMDNDFRRGLWYGLFSPTPVMPMSWWWEFFESRGMMEYFKNVRSFSDTMLHTCGDIFESFEVAGNSGQKTYGVRCSCCSYIYIDNNSVQPVDIAVTTQNIPAGLRKVMTYDCETGKFSEADISLAGNTIKIENTQLEPKSGLILFWEM